MRSTHKAFRLVSIAIGLALLMVAGTAAMIGVISSPAPVAGLDHPLAIPPVRQAEAMPPVERDTLLYQRVAGRDGITQWVLTEEPGTPLSKGRNAADTLAGINASADTGGLNNAGYGLLARPAGLNKVVRICSSTVTRAKSKAPDAYDMLCNTVSES
jgi:hypothetical protein